MTLLLEILIAFLAFTIMMGMIQPWWVLWWMSKQNRAMVLKYYGVITLLFVILYFIL